MNKEEILQAIEKFKQICVLQEEINFRVPICGKLEHIHIYKFEDYKTICNLLNIEDIAIKPETLGDDSDILFHSAYYDNVKIFSIEHLDYENK